MIAQGADLTFTYAENEAPAVSPTSFELVPNSVTAITGRNDSGKTTLQRVLAGLAPAVFRGDVGGRGQVLGSPLPLLDGPPTDAGVLTDSAATQLTGLKTTVAGEVAISLENRGWSEERIRSRLSFLLPRLRLEPLAERSPDRLSGGELQRVLIAAAIAHAPRLVLMDEPGLHLDPQTRQALRSILTQEAEDGCAILLTFPTDDEARDAGAESSIRLPPRGHHLTPTFGSDVLFPRGDDRELLSFHDASFAYPGGTRAAANLNLRTHRGEVVGLTGANGSGKTTLARLALGLLRPDSGRIKVRGRDTRTARASSVAHDIGLVFQNPADQLFHGSAWKEVSFGPRLRRWNPSEVEQLAATALEATGLFHLRETNPRDLGGSKRRLLSLACMLASRPSLLILDEPTAGLDDTEREVVGQIVREWARQGGGVLAVSHDLEWAQLNCDYLLRMEGGVLDRS